MMEARAGGSLHFPRKCENAALCLSLAALILGYQALFDTITGGWRDAVGKITWSAVAAVAALLLIRYRGDLIDS